MDKNTVIGLFLIGLLLVAYSIYMQPSKEQKTALERKRDTIAAIENQQKKAGEQSEIIKAKSTINEINEDTAIILSDSLNAISMQNRWGLFAGAVEGENTYFTLENEKIKVTLSTLGGRVCTVELKKYKTHDSLPLFLFDEDSSSFGINFFEDKRDISTRKLFFTPIGKSFQVKGGDSSQFIMRLYADSQDRYIEYVYSLKGNSNLLHFNLNVVGLEDIIAKNDRVLNLNWNIEALSKENNIETERSSSTVYYKYKNDEVDYISESKSEKQNLEAKVEWVAFKQQYFTVAIISESGFEKTGSDVEASTNPSSTKYTRYMATNLSIPFDNNTHSFPMVFYFGPCHYQTLKKLNIDMENQISLGWTIIGWISKVLVIPIFNFLDSFNWNYGIIILILTLVIKTILFPITYKTYLSSAKMRVLKPEIDELNKKFKKEDALKKQQATMALYKQAGVNPMAGCIPMLIQFPILFAMFKFFPASIELRQQGFLWATDLSTYDSIFSWETHIPLISSFYGNHISLFTLLMAASTFIYTKYNTPISMGSGIQEQQMKIMTYFMPFMLLVFFNKFSSGLSYYYFLANVISIGQNYVIKQWFIDEEAIHKKIQENKKNPKAVKKSGFQKRLEEMAKKKGYKMYK